MQQALADGSRTEAVGNDIDREDPVGCRSNDQLLGRSFQLGRGKAGPLLEINRVLVAVPLLTAKRVPLLSARIILGERKGCVVILLAAVALQRGIPEFSFDAPDRRVGEIEVGR